MIKKITLQNIYGIKEETTFNFELKHLKENQLLFENSIVNENKIMLTPTLISKNASGKTSFLKAILYASKIDTLEDLRRDIFADFYDFVEEMNYAFYSLIINIILRGDHKGDENRLKNYMAEDLIREMHRWAPSIKRKNPIFKKPLSEQVKSFEEINIIFEEEIEKIFKRKIDESFKEYEFYKETLNTEKTLTINIEYCDGTKKYIEIGKTLKVNKDSINIDMLINSQKRNDFWLSNGIPFLNNCALYINGIEDLDYLNNNINEYSTYKDLDNYKKEWILPSYIDDSYIRSHNENILDNSLLFNLIDFYSFNFINETLKSIDNDISHLEMQKNQSYSIVSLDGTLKSINTLSFGTLKVLYILSEMIPQFSLKDSGLILIDEIENGLNISLIKLITSIITNDKVNRNNTQVIMTTHNASLFENGIISPYNAFIFVDNKFIRPIDDKNIIERTENLKRIFLSRNYYNESFWLTKSKDNVMNTNTVGRKTISSLIDILEDEMYG